MTTVVSARGRGSFPGTSKGTATSALATVPAPRAVVLVWPVVLVVFVAFVVVRAADEADACEPDEPQPVAANALATHSTTEARRTRADNVATLDDMARNGSEQPPPV